MNKYEKLFKEVTGENFNDYYLEHKPKLTWFISKGYTKDMDKAEDFANQAFMQALEKIETYDSNKSKLITWLTKIAINLVIKDWKDNHKYNFISFERDTSESPSLLNLLINEENNYDYLYEDENKKKCEIIYNVIENLPDKYKKVMVLRELKDKSYKDISNLIRKENKIEMSNDKIKLSTVEDFFSLDVTNTGYSDLYINFVSSDNRKNIYTLTISPQNNVSITRDDIEWEISSSDDFILDSSETSVNGLYVTKTNLSTIKSQIKKGRELIRKKVKKKFENINENGVKDFF